MKNWVCDGLDFLFKRRRWSRLCSGPSEVALRLLWWSHLSQWRLLASEAADDTAQISVARFGCVEHGTPRWTNSQIEKQNSEAEKSCVASPTKQNKKNFEQFP